MSSAEFRHALYLRLGLVVKDRPQKCICKNAVPIDDTLSHLLSCHAFTAEKFRRHEEIVGELKKLGAAAHVSVTERGLMLEGEGNERPDLRFHRIGENNQDLDIDVTITFSGSESYVRNHTVDTTRGEAIACAEKRKNDKYLTKCRANSIDFKPIVFDAFGLPSKTTVEFITNLVKRASEVSSIPHYVLSFYWKRRISMALQRANSRLLIQSQQRIYKKFVDEEDIQYGPQYHYMT